MLWDIIMIVCADVSSSIAEERWTKKWYKNGKRHPESK